MNKSSILEAIKKAREASSKKKFNQTFDLILNLKELNLKNPEQKLDIFVTLPKGLGKKRKLCALVDNALYTEAKDTFDKTILKSDFPNISQKDAKKLAQDYDYFIAQANIMPDIAKSFGKILGVRGKMPNPKSGAIVPPKATLKPIYEKFQKIIRLITKTDLTVKCAVGREDMEDDDVAENILAVYNAAVHALPQESANVKKVLLKLTMGAPVGVGN
ncbi:MAG: 50S ribosomal protein L1 [archaeon]